MERSTPDNYQDPLRAPFPSPSQSFDLSTLEFILVLFAVIMVPSFIYTLFLFIKCRPDQHRDSAELHPSSDDGGKEPVSKLINYDKDAHVQNIGGDCPVCLSLFADGDEIRQLSLCNHSFHASCIDLWLRSHSNCPVCRAEVKGLGNRTRRMRTAGHHEDDYRQGLPDSASLI